MEFTTWCGKKRELFECPFCGSDPELHHIGNDHTRKRSIEIKCPKCRISRKNSAIIHGFDWLEDVSVKQWNERV